MAEGPGRGAAAALAVLVAVTVPGCGVDAGVTLQTPADEPAEPVMGDPVTPRQSPTSSVSPSTTGEPVGQPSPTGAATAVDEARVVTDRWEQVPSLDGSLPAHDSDIERAIDTALADPDFHGWLEWFAQVTVTHIRTRGDGVLVHMELDPSFDPDIPEHHRHGYPTPVCFKGTSTNVIAGIVWLVDPGERRVLASSPMWADGMNCALW